MTKPGEQAHRDSTAHEARAADSSGTPTDAKRTDAHRHTHIVLLGLMGAGKSTVGRIVANELGRPFVDSDSIVELQSGRSPAALAESASLDELHELEVESARHVLAISHAVVYAAAASVVDTLDVADLGRSWVVWLEASPKELARRTAAGGPRPGLGADTARERIFTEQLRQRGARARELAHAWVDTEDRTPRQVAATVCDGWRAYVAIQHPSSGHTVR